MARSKRVNKIVNLVYGCILNIMKATCGETSQIQQLHNLIYIPDTACILTFTPTGVVTNVMLCFMTGSVSRVSIQSNRCNSLTVKKLTWVNANCCPTQIPMRRQ
jgi:hypothetical protein